MRVSAPSFGERAVERCDALGAAPYSEAGDHLFRPYLTPSHKASLERVGAWMREAGMAVRLDPLGNLIGRYEGRAPGAPALLIGSHIDTVSHGGRYDGALGVMLGIECVDALNRSGWRAPFAVEVIAFGDEEGSRFPVSMLCSRGICAPAAAESLERADAGGVTLGQALTAFGLDPGQIARAARAPGEVLAYVEAHIEQGPTLEAEGLALGVVTGIAAQLRIKARFTGLAGHAGTSPMGLRKDAVAAAAAAVLAVEEICRAGPEDLRGTVGRFLPSTAAYNVIAGEVEFGLDVRAATEPVRDRAAAQIRARLEAIAAERGVTLDYQVMQDLPATPCDPRLMRLMAEAIGDVGGPPFALVSGAGHDAMAVAALCPVAMLFIRCEGGISHNAAEAVAGADVALAAQALVAFVVRLAEEEAA
jgi:allantoate deiminase